MGLFTRVNLFPDDDVGSRRGVKSCSYGEGENGERSDMAIILLKNISFARIRVS